MADQIAQILAQMQQLPGQQIAPIGQMQTASAPFTWGQGGARLSPEQLAAQQASAQDRMRSDYSPVQSIWQGLGRVADNVTGALDARSLEGEQEKIAADRSAQIAALLGPNADPNVAAGLGSGDKAVSGVAEALYKASLPKTQNPTDFQQMLQAGGIMPGTPEYAKANLARAESLSDPLVTVSLPDGGIFNGPASQLAAVLKGGGQSSVATPVASPGAPAQLPADFDFGGQTPPASGNFP